MMIVTMMLMTMMTMKVVIEGYDYGDVGYNIEDDSDNSGWLLLCTVASFILHASKYLSLNYLDHLDCIVIS